MAGDPLDTLRLTLMQELLPVGLAVVERARRGGPGEVMAAFDGGSGEAISRLRQEGEPAARQVRDGLDRVQPGLGNPVVRVSVRDVPGPEAGAQTGPDPADPAELQQVLGRIGERLALLESRLAVADDARAASMPRS